MKFILLLGTIIFSSCVTKKICINQIENNRSIYDVDNSCRLRIRQVIIGSDVEVPKSIDFKSGVHWTYSWQESKFENGKLTLGHFIMTPVLAKTSGSPNGN